MDKNLDNKLNQLAPSLSPPMRLFMAMALVVVISFGMFAIQAILAPFLFAVITGICAAPLLYWLVKKKVPKVLAGIITLIVVGGLFIGVLLIVLISVGGLAANKSEYVANAQQQLAELTGSIESLDEPAATAVNMALDPQKAADTIENLLNELSSLLIFGVTMFLFVLYMIFDMDAFQRVFDGLFGPDSKVVSRFSGFVHDIQSYVWTQSWTGAIIGIANTLFLYWYGIPYPILWGVLSFFMGFIPNIGFWIALIPPALLAFSIYGWQGALVVIVFYNLVNGGMEIFIKPKVIGHSVSVSTTVVFLSLTYWGFILGPWGGLLAVPLTVMLKDLVLDAYPQTRPLSALISLQVKNLPSDAAVTPVEPSSAEIVSETPLPEESA